MNLYLKKAVVHGPKPGTKRVVDQIYVRGTEIVFIILPEMLRHAPMFNRITHWRKHGGAPPEGVGAAVGQAAAILRKASERRRGGLAAGDVGDLEGVVVQGEEVLREVMGLRLDITDIDENEGIMVSFWC